MELSNVEEKIKNKDLKGVDKKRLLKSIEKKSDSKTVEK